MVLLPAKSLLLLLPLAAVEAAPPACTTLTGWWGGNGILQQGSAISVDKGDVTSAPGKLDGNIGIVRPRSVFPSRMLCDLLAVACPATFNFKNMCPHPKSEPRSCEPLNATVSSDCKTLTFTNGAVWHQGCPDPPGHLSPSPRAPCGEDRRCCAEGKVCARTKCVDAPSFSKVHVVYMTHLDLGFTNSTRSVCDTYFDIYFPAAFETASSLRASCTDKKTCPVFRWTEFPWIIQEFLDGGAGCAHTRRTVEQLQAMVEAIGRDDVIWHANAVK